LARAAAGLLGKVRSTNCTGGFYTQTVNCRKCTSLHKRLSIQLQ
jgi:hypothetical protein